MCSSFKAFNHNITALYYYAASRSRLQLPYQLFPLFLPTSSLARTAPHSSLSPSRAYSSCQSSHTGTLMDVVKSVYKQGSSAGDSIAITADQKSYSYKQVISSALEISNLLCSTGLKTVDGAAGNGHLGGARIGIVAKPSAEFVAGVLATWFSGGVAVPLALSHPESELLHVMNDSEISMVLSTEDYRELLENIAVKCAARFSLIPAVAKCASRTTEHDYSILENIDLGKGENPALIVYTSGTTGKPKGAVHTHKSIAAQVQTLTEAWEYSSRDKFLHCLPLHHILSFISV